MMAGRPRYKRANPPPPMRFQKRDGDILRFLYDCDGVVAKRQLHQHFWAGRSRRAMEKRLSLLYHNGYLDWVGQEQWRRQAVPEPICWLGYRGIGWLAGKRGINTPPIEAPNETKLRKLAQSLRGADIYWQREPRWSQLAHDIAVTDFRLKVKQSVEGSPKLRMEEWIPEGAFLRLTDEVKFTVQGRDGRDYQRKKGVRPDGMFMLHDEARQAKGLPAGARFLLELDNVTHSIPNFGREKVLPGIAYLKSEAYRTRFGTTSGRWLIVTKGGMGRLRRLMEKTSEAAGDETRLFLFACWGTSQSVMCFMRQSGINQIMSIHAPFYSPASGYRLL